MNAKISVTELDKIGLAAITRIGEFEKLNDDFQRLMKWGHEQRLVDTSSFKAISIYHDNPHVTHISKVRHSAGITVNRTFDTSQEIRFLTIQQGVYAVGRFEVIGDHISKAWKNLNIWVIDNGYEFRDGDFFEIYYNDSKVHPENKFVLDICIPLVKPSNIKLGNSIDAKFPIFKQNNTDETGDYHQIVNYMKELRAYLNKEYESEYTLGRINQTSKDYSYFSFTPEWLKTIKLKFVIIFDHILNCFTICLSGQNKSIRKKYWLMFKGSDWDKYHIAESIDKSLMIVDHVLIEKPNFHNREHLTQEIDKEAFMFINEFKIILE